MLKQYSFELQFQSNTTSNYKALLRILLNDEATQLWIQKHRSCLNAKAIQLLAPIPKQCNFKLQGDIAYTFEFRSNIALNSEAM